MTIFLVSCQSNRLSPENYQSMVETQDKNALVVFQTRITGVLPPADYHLTLDFYQKGRSGFNCRIPSDTNTHLFVYHLPPGVYQLRRLEMSGNGSRIGTLGLNIQTRLQAGTVHYLGTMELHRETWSSNAAPGTMPPFSYLQAGWAKHNLSLQYAAGWNLQIEDQLSNTRQWFQEDYPLLDKLTWVNLCPINE